MDTKPFAKAALIGSLFGEFSVSTQTGASVQPKNRRAALILAILFLQPKHSIDRDTLTRLLWHDRFTAQAKASLRQCLSDLRKHLDGLEIGVLSVDRNEVTLLAHGLSSDLADLETALSLRKLDDAAEMFLAIGNRPLLEGLTLNPEFDAWLAARRKHIDTRLKAAVYKALNGQQTKEAKALYDAAQLRFPSIRTDAPYSERLAMAVLPFTQVDDVDDDFFLAEAILDEFSSTLGRVNGLALIGRTSVAAIIAKGGTLPEIAKDLRVSHLIEGEIRRRPDSIEVRIALIEGQSGTELWSRRVTGSIEDFLKTRSVIGSNIIAAICSALGLASVSAPARPMTGNRDAYALYLQGRNMLQRLASDGALPKAIQLFEQALEIDPRFAECWTSLADAHIMIAATTPTLERVEHTEKGAQRARQALELDASQAHAYSVLGVAEWCRFNPSKALDLAFEAYTRNPNDADVSSRLGSTLLYLGKSKEALPYVEAAVDRDPVYGRNYVMLCSAYLNLGEIDKARNCAHRMVDLGAPRMWLAMAQFIAGDYEAAVQSHYANRFFLGTTIMRPPGMPPMDDAARDAYFEFAARGIFSGKEADRAAYSQMLNGLHAAMADPYDPSILLPAVWMGHSELVMKIYSERIHPANIFGLMNLWIDADPFNRTRQHPDFMAFADKIGLTDAWNRHGWPDLMPSDPRQPSLRTN